MPVKTFNGSRRPGAYIVGEVEFLARSAVTFAEGAVIQPGTVVAKLTASGKYVPLAAAAADPATGSHVAAGIAFAEVDASDDDAEGVITARLTAVNDAELIWPAGITAQNKTAALTALAALNIIAR